MSVQTRISELAQTFYPQAVALRRHFHKYPEVSFKEFQTTEKVIEELQSLGFEVHRPLETGCVAVLEGGQPSDRVIALRADIDALPMNEEGEHKADFLSQNPGAAHCCGHDLHTANLLGVARILNELKTSVPGRVVLVFQPGEEKSPGGGNLLMKTGILQKLGVQSIFGLHSYPFGRPGEVHVIKGPMMARTDEFALEITGKGGHAAIPHKAVDPIVIASQVITVLQSIVSRHVNPLESAVVTIGKISGGTAHNVIPASVQMLGTIRTFSKELTERICTQIEKTASGIAEAAGGSAKLTFTAGYPAVINDPGAVDLVVETASAFDDVQSLYLSEPLMAGEDFAFYQEEIPGSYMYLGSGSEETGSDQWNWHHPRYNCDEKAMLTGMKLMSALVFASK